MRVFLQSEGRGVWEVVRAPLILPAVDAPAYEALLANDHKAKNLLYGGLGRQEYDRICNLETAHEIWKTLETYHEGSSQIKQVRQTVYKKEYNKFEMRPGESIDDIFSRFNTVINQMKSVGIEYTQSENATHLLAAINTREWEIKATAIQENVNFSDLTLELLYSKLKTHEIQRGDHSKKDNMALVADPLKRASDGSFESSSGISLASLSAIQEEDLESIPEPEMALLIKKFTRAYNNMRNKKRGGPVTCYECGELNHIRANCPKLKGKNNHKDEKPAWKKPQGRKSKFDEAKLRKAAHRVLAALGDRSMSDVDSGSEEDKEEELLQDKKGKAKDFTGMCFMADSDDIDDNDEVSPSYDVLVSRCETIYEQMLGQDKALKFIMTRNEELESQVDKLTLELVNAKSLESDECSSCHALHSELAKLQSAHDIALQQLESARTELIEVKSAPCEKCLESSKLVVSDVVESSVCSVCLEREREVHDVVEAARAKYAKLKDSIDSATCASCEALKLEVALYKKRLNAKTCDSCVNFGKEIAYLKDTLERFSKGEKQLNMILDKSKTPYKKQGLGYNFAQDKSNGIQILKNGLVEFDTQPAKITFKSAGFAQPSVQSKGASPSGTKYHCTYCKKDGHLVEFCWRRLKNVRRNLARMSSHQPRAFMRNGHLEKKKPGLGFIAHAHHHHVPRQDNSHVRVTIAHNRISNRIKDSTVALYTTRRRVSQYWVPKSCLTNPSIETHRSFVP